MFMRDLFIQSAVSMPIISEELNSYYCVFVEHGILFVRLQQAD